MDRRAVYALVAVSAVAAGVLLWLSRSQTFFADEWNFLVGYPDWSPGTLLHPNSGNLIAAPAVVYKAMTAVFGAESYLPFRILWVAFDLLSACLFYALARKRVGDWAALAPTTLLLYFGAAWEVLGGPLGITILMAVSSGLGMLLCLERRDRAGDLGAALLLIISLATYTVGIAFAAGAIVELAVARGRAGRRSAWVVVAPLALYGAWRIWAAHFGGADVGIGDVLTLPGSMTHSLVAVTASITGTFRDPVNSGLVSYTDAGRTLGVGLAGFVAWRLLGPARRNLDPMVWVFLAMPLAYWALIGANLGPLRVPEASRYQYPGAVFVLLLGVQLFAGVQLRRRGYAVLTALLAFCLLGNLAHLRDAGRFLRDNGDENRGELAALELAGGDRVDPGLLVEPLTGAVSPIEDMAVTAGAYFDAFEDDPSPAYTLEELAGRPEHVRARADVELVRALAIAAVPAPAPARSRPPGGLAAEASSDGEVSESAGCLTLTPQLAGAALAFRPGPAGFTISPSAAAEVRLRRFGESFSALLAPPPPGATALVAIAADESDQPWHAQVVADQAVTVCAA